MVNSRAAAYTASTWTHHGRLTAQAHVPAVVRVTGSDVGSSTSRTSLTPAP